MIKVEKETEILPIACFLSNEKFLDESIPAGGVKQCTDEYRTLLKSQYALQIFSVKYRQDWKYRFRKKLGVSSYEDYKIESYRSKLEGIIGSGVSIFFLNLTNTAPFAALIKSINKSATVILCSHGNESGDFLHDTVLHNKFKGLNRKFAFYNLGKLIATESFQRQYIDLVLSVSPIESAIENWLGASSVYMVPRSLVNHSLETKFIPGRIGFFSDLSHEPNFYGISKLCESIEAVGGTTIKLVLAGGGQLRAERLCSQFPFVEYAGYLPDLEFEKELSTWSFALNPVFYYSRGVSTKLGKSLSYGLPVISTSAGLRGYEWRDGELPLAESPDEMAILIDKICSDRNIIEHYRKETQKIINSSRHPNDIMKEIIKVLKR